MPFLLRYASNAATGTHSTARQDSEVMIVPLRAVFSRALRHIPSDTTEISTCRPKAANTAYPFLHQREK